MKQLLPGQISLADVLKWFLCVQVDTPGVYLQNGNRMLRIYRVQPEHAGKFSCMAQNSAGEARREYSIVVQGKHITIFLLTLTKIKKNKQNKSIQTILAALLHFQEISSQSKPNVFRVLNIKQTNHTALFLICSSAGDLRSISNAGVDSGTGPGGGVSVPSEWETTASSGMEPRWRVSIFLVVTFSASSSPGSNPKFFFSLQSSVTWWRPPCRVSRGWTGVEGEVRQTEGSGDLSVSGEQQRGNPNAPVQTHSARSRFLTLTVSETTLSALFWFIS